MQDIRRKLILTVSCLLLVLGQPLTALAQETLKANDEKVFTTRLSLPYGPPVTTEVAKLVTAAALAEGAKNGWTVAVAVVDTGGQLVYFERMDNTQHASPIIAIEKAQTAVNFRRSTKLVEDRVKAGLLNYLALPGAQPIEGGVPIIVNGQIVGGVAVSGARSFQDGICAKAALDALAAAE